MTARLGPFQLIAPLDAGGMASIWTARHLESGTPVAAKLIPPGKLTTQSRAALEREIQTAAGLDHPGIICIVDQGTIDAQVALATGGQIDEGSPYLMMEFCSHTLGSLLPLTTWGELRTILVSLLDALAYAHARGVIHRDLKPGNVLFGGPDDLRPGLKIADFGIAHALDAPGFATGARKLMGTPRYMSPEQVEGDVRLLGPGSDLYSLGAMTFKCIHGHGPFQSSGARLLFDHLRTPAPPLDVPDGFPKELAHWVASLLRKDVNERPVSAAAALRSLPEGPLHPLIPPTLDEEEMATAPLTTARLATLSLGRTDAREQRFEPVPSRWRTAKPYGGSPRLRDVGRALLGLRPIPLAGRTSLRDSLWTAFRQSANRGEVVIVLLSAQEGLGRTRMVEWLHHRVGELGCGAHLRLRTQRRMQRGPVLRQLLAEVFRAGNATGDDLAERLLDGHARLGLQPGPLVGFALRDDAETDLIAAAVAQLLERMANLGPLVVSIDDLHHVPGLLVDLETWQQINGPVLIVVTAREEALVADPELESLALRCTFHHVLHPLEPVERQHLFDSILPLSPSLAAQVDQRTNGNPRFAIQLITDWVQRGILSPGPTGFDAPRDLHLPPSLAAIWSSRLRHLLTDFPAHADKLLEVAAALGNDVAEHELRTLLPDEEPLWQALIARMVLHRLVSPRPGGFVFSHPAIREVLLSRANRKGRLADHHRKIAALLEGSTDPEAIARRGHHRAGAGDPRGAFEDLFAAAQFQRYQAAFRRALVLCDEAQELLKTGDRRTVLVKALRARTLNGSHNHTAGRQEAEGAVDLAEAKGWTPEGAVARLQLGIAYFHSAEYQRCAEQMARVLHDCDPSDLETRAGAYNHLAWTHVLREDIPTALPFYTKAAETHLLRGDLGRLDGLLVLADRANFEQKYEDAEALVEEALTLVTDPPRLVLLPYLLERRVYLALSRGHLERALAAGIELRDSPGLQGSKSTRARSLLASVHLKLNQDAEAHNLWLRCSQPQHLPESPLERSIVYAGLLASAHDAGSTTLESWARALEASIPDPPARHPVARELLQLAADRLPYTLAWRCEQLLKEAG